MTGENFVNFCEKAASNPLPVPWFMNAHNRNFVAQWDSHRSAQQAVADTCCPGVRSSLVSSTSDVTQCV